MTGSADTMGAGAKVLMKGLVGGTFGSAAKITGTSVVLFLNRVLFRASIEWLYKDPPHFSYSDVPRWLQSQQSPAPRAYPIHAVINHA